MKTLAAMILTGGCVLTLGGCGTKDDGRVTSQLPPTPAGPKVEFPELDHAPTGDLLTSGERIAGLDLPKGLTVAFAGNRRHVYTSEAPIGRVLQYFGPRLMTAEINESGDAITYLRAVPKGVEGGIVQLNVTIRPRVGGGTSITIVELEPPTQQEVPAAEIQQRIARDSVYWD